MGLFSTLMTRCDIDFFDTYISSKDTHPKWWRKALFGQWKSTKAASVPYDKILNQCNISLGKIVHMRSSGIEYASSIGELSGA